MTGIADRIERTLCFPTALCLKVVDRLIGGITAPVSSLALLPSWINLVEKWCRFVVVVGVDRS